MTVFCSVPSEASPSIILARGIASEQAIAIDKYYATRHQKIIYTQLAMAFGKNGFNPSICASVNQKRLLIITPVSSGA